MIHETKLRVRYAEIDAQGHVNNAVYLSYFEVGRVEWLRAAGLSYRELEERGYGIVVVEVLAHYRRAAFFDDELTLRTELAALSRASMRFEYVVSRGGDVLVTGHTRHACVDVDTCKRFRVPEELLAAARKAS